MMRGVGAAGPVAFAFWATGAAAMDRTFLVFGGFGTENDFGEVIAVTPIDPANVGLIGVAPGLSWDLPDPRFKFSVEAQVVKYFGDQQSWEFNIVPAMIRWFPKEQPGLRSLGFGMGYSWASEPPELEASRGNGGVTSQDKWYWAFEIGFETERPDRDVVLRLHHRSTGSGSIGEGRSTNAVVLGIRQSF